MSRDVQVHEENTWDWKNQMEAKQGKSLSVAPIITPMTSEVHDDEEEEKEPHQPKMRSL